jgi:leader peptidase (prepilin peptidase) / N-methyltransferase
MPCAPIITLADLPIEYTYYYTAFLGVIGAIVGSFLNVVALRQLNDEEFIKTPSHCYACNYKLYWYDNIPILSWLLLRGKCRECGTSIHWQYPVVEAFTSALFIATGLMFGPIYLLLPLFAMLASFVVMSITDFRERIIYSMNALWLVPVGLAVHAFGLDNNLITALAWIPRWTMETGTLLDASFWSALIGVAGVFVIFESLIWLSKKLVGREAFGHGDTLILMAVAAFLGWEQTVATLILGALLTGITTLPLMLGKWAKQGQWGLFNRLVGALGATGGMFLLSKLEVSRMMHISLSSVILVTTLFLLFGFLKKLRETDSFTEAPFGPGLMMAAFLLLLYGHTYMPKIYSKLGAYVGL